jgi:MFS family permease
MAPVVFLLGALIQQVRYPDSAAWIVALLATGYLVLVLVVGRLVDRKVDSGKSDRNFGA